MDQYQETIGELPYSDRKRKLHPLPINCLKTTACSTLVVSTCQTCKNGNKPVLIGLKFIHKNLQENDVKLFIKNIKFHRKILYLAFYTLNFRQGLEAEIHLFLPGFSRASGLFFTESI